MYMDDRNEQVTEKEEQFFLSSNTYRYPVGAYSIKELSLRSFLLIAVIHNSI